MLFFFFRCLSLHISLVAFQRAVKRKFAPLFSLFPISLRFTDQLIPLSSVCLSCFFFFALPLPFQRKNTHIHRHTHVLKKSTNWHAHPPISHPSLLCVPQPPTPLCPYLPHPIVESTGGSSQYMYSWLLCGHHDNHHEFDMALTYPGGCELVWMQRFKWRSRI